MSSQDKPKSIGLLLFQDFEALDVFGPINCLNALSRDFPLNLSIITHSLTPTNTYPTEPGPHNSNFTQAIVPTHTFDNPPEDLEVLFVPGGLGMYLDTQAVKEAVEFIKRVYPKLKYLNTICTGSELIARAGVLDGKRATSNKAFFTQIKANQPQVNWVPKARWVVDGNIYTSSGVTAGIDMTLAFIKDVYGAQYADQITDRLEYDRHTESTEDPFAHKYGLA
jgi:transcriptional regulator GlxA family with amidase domain